jgi:hypothetical protein
MVVELLPFAILLVVLVLFGVLVRHVIRLKRNVGERRVQLEAAIAAQGYRPIPEDVDDFMEGLRGSPRFQRGTLQIPLLLAKEAGGATRYVAEYTNIGRHGETLEDRGILFASRLGADRLPRFLLHPSTNRLPKLIKAGIDKAVNIWYPRFQPVPMESCHPDLEHCLMYAEDRDSGIRVLDGDVIGALLAAQGWGLESTGSWLLAEKDKRGGAPPKKVDEILAQLQEFERIAPAFEH